MGFSGNEEIQSRVLLREEGTHSAPVDGDDRKNVKGRERVREGKNSHKWGGKLVYFERKGRGDDKDDESGKSLRNPERDNKSGLEKKEMRRKGGVKDKSQKGRSFSAWGRTRFEFPIAGQKEEIEEGSE